MLDILMRFYMLWQFWPQKDATFLEKYQIGYQKLNLEQRLAVCTFSKMVSSAFQEI